MRLLFIAGSIHQMSCGVGDYTMLLASEMASESSGVTIGVLTSTQASKIIGPSNVEILPCVRSWGGICFADVIQAIKRWQPDIVHIQYPTKGYGASIFPYWLPCVLLNLVPIVQTWHEPLVPHKALLRYLLAALPHDNLVVVEADYKSTLPNWFNWLIRHKRFRSIPVAASIPRMVLTDNEKHSIRQQFDAVTNNLVVHFGNPKPSKGIETIFDIADPLSDRIVIIGQINNTDPYHRRISEKMNTYPWLGKAFATGFLDPESVGKLLAASDAAIYPFIEGVNQRNTSFLAAKNQGTFTLTFSRTRRGYDPSENIYYVNLGNIAEMQQALRIHKSRRLEVEPGRSDWGAIVEKHLSLYSEILNSDKE